MIKLENLHKSFGNNDVLRGVNIEINKGSSMVVIGGSGTGKSVVLKCVLGLVTPDQGRIFVKGRDVTKTDQDTFMSKFGHVLLVLPVSQWPNIFASGYKNFHSLKTFSKDKN